MIVEQFLPAFHYGDAIGNSTLTFHEFLLSRGIESRIVAMTIDPSMSDKAVPFDTYTSEPAAIKILHFAVPSGLTDFFLAAGGKKVMIYHNVTPPRFFTDFSADLVRFTAVGRDHLQRLSGCFDLAVADSRYNAGELQEMDFKNVKVFPIMIKLEEYDREFCKPYYELLKDERRHMVFVGRITPNKKIEDLIKTLFFYKKYLSPAIRLVVAGNTGTLPKYFNAIQDLAGRFHLNSEDIHFTGHIPFTELLAVYRLADVFVSMSEHEGFCLPLIESCYFQVPVVAYRTGAVPETLGDAGILINHKRVDQVAAMIEQVIQNESLRRVLKCNSLNRIEAYRRESRPELLLDLLENL
jgi:L-malate glycosyltransferase